MIVLQTFLRGGKGNLLIVVQTFPWRGGKAVPVLDSPSREGRQYILIVVRSPLRGGKQYFLIIVHSPLREGRQYLLIVVQTFLGGREGIVHEGLVVLATEFDNSRPLGVGLILLLTPKT